VGHRAVGEDVVGDVQQAGQEGAIGADGLGLLGVAVAAGPLQEARSALAALGYKPVEIQRFTDAAYKEGMTTEQIIQEALKRAVR